MDIHTICVYGVCFPPSPSCLVHIYECVRDFYLFEICIISLPFFSSELGLNLILPFDLPSDPFLEKKLLAMTPGNCRIFSLMITELWPRDFVTCPRSHNLLIQVVHSVCTSYQFTQAAPGTPVQSGVRTPVLSLGIHPFLFLLITPLFIFRFH